MLNLSQAISEALSKNVLKVETLAECTKKCKSFRLDIKTNLASTCGTCGGYKKPRKHNPKLLKGLKSLV